MFTIQDIYDNLTGDSKKDNNYLKEQYEKYKHHEFADELLRSISRLIYENTLKIDNIDEKMKEINSLILKKDFNKALEMIEPLVSVTEEIVKLFFDNNDKDYEYRCFINPIDRPIYATIFKRTNKVRHISKYCPIIYYNYGALLFELKRYDEAKIILEKANELNPIGSSILLELSEIYKICQNWDGYLEITNKCLEYAYYSSVLARCYRNYAFYFVEQCDYDMAVALLAFSINIDSSEQGINAAQTELQYIKTMAGKSIEFPTFAKAEKMLKKHNIQIGPNGLILNVVFYLAEEALNNNINEQAKYCYEIIYDLTKDEKVKAIMESL
jgi:tetratricopeptide (TPR) repeat protein